MMRIEISGVHAPVEDKLKRYIRRKIGGLDRYIPRRSRKSAWAEVRLKEAGAKGKNEYECRVVLHLPAEPLTVHETTVNMYAAVDIAEEKLKHAIRRYKEKHQPARIHHRLMRHWRQSSVSSESDS